MSDLERRRDENVVIPAEQVDAVYKAGNEMYEDLQLALSLLQKYQRNLSMLQAPDPELVAARDLLRRYKMSYEGWSGAFRVLVDGLDITDHPDSIEGSLANPDVIELESGDDSGT